MPRADVYQSVLCGIAIFACLKPDRSGLSLYRLPDFFIDPAEINRAVRSLYKLPAGSGLFDLVQDVRVCFAESPTIENGFDLGGSEGLVF